MLDELRDETIIRKVGGRFKLTTLIQKRLIQLNKGTKPLVHMPPGTSNLEITVAEIMQDKIFLSMKDELQTVPEEDMRDYFDSI